MDYGVPLNEWFLPSANKKSEESLQQWKLQNTTKLDWSSKTEKSYKSFFAESITIQSRRKSARYNVPLGK